MNLAPLKEILISLYWGPPTQERIKALMGTQTETTNQ